MKFTKPLQLLILLSSLSFCGCRKNNQINEPSLISIQVIDRNGFAETVSSKDRLVRYKNTDFCQPQPYQKVLRVFGKNTEGNSASKITSYHPNGQVWQYLEVLDGRAHGSYKEWHPNGRIKMEFSIIEGMADLSESAINSWIFEGKNTIWSDQGELIAEIFYEKGMLHGDSLYYYPDGSLQKKIPYFQDEIQGTITLFSSSGEILEEISYLKDKPEGISSARKEDGSPLYQETFSEGLLLEGTYYKIPEKYTPVFIHEGNGKRAEFIQERLARIVEYRKGTPEGLVTCFNEQGILHISYEQKEGKKHGEEREYYLDNPSQVKISINWQEDVLQGTTKTWFPNGKQESQKEMYQNKKNGAFLAWYKNGDLMLSEEYENDILNTGSYYKKGNQKPVSRIINGKGTVTLHDPEGYFLKKIPYEKGVPLIENDLIK